MMVMVVNGIDTGSIDPRAEQEAAVEANQKAGGVSLSGARVVLLEAL